MNLLRLLAAGAVLTLATATAALARDGAASARTDNEAGEEDGLMYDSPGPDESRSAAPPSDRQDAGSGPSAYKRSPAGDSNDIFSAGSSPRSPVRGCSAAGDISAGGSGQAASCAGAAR